MQNLRLFDGSVRCVDCFDASSYADETDAPCTYCQHIPKQVVSRPDFTPGDQVVVSDEPGFIEVDSVPEPPIGAEGLPIYTVEQELKAGNIERVDLDAYLFGYRMAQPQSTPVFLDKPLDHVTSRYPIDMEQSSVPEPYYLKVRDLTPNLDIRLGSGREGTVDAVDPCLDRRGRLGIYLIERVGGQVRKVRLHPEREVLVLV